ncbi:hypothetical protein DAPK24_012700 [Pichia kluyveri]|uniref:Uncharacterized protein n=1 Tax=Pichia kluyveri TaxID=36015 RepID=A0AAV5QZT6_PICKL|nr:hypothetical protein DAPK24_012700 [Pichia kluyveri]
MLQIQNLKTEESLLLATTVVSLISIPSIYYFFNNKKNGKAKAAVKQEKEFPKPTIVPVSDDFDWEKQTPYPYRPYKKGPYKMNLAIRKLDPNDIICIEDTYLDRVTLREKLFDEKKLSGFHESALDSLKETYRFIFNHLLQRYPKYFTYSNDKKTIINKIKESSVPANPSDLSGNELLRIIASNIEEDMLLLIKNNDEGEPDEYVLRASTSLFPAGFNPAQKMNLPLTKIHTPVPHYVEKLQTSMNKFFSRIKPYEFIIRNNWSIQTHTNLCAPTGSHATKEEATTIHPLYPQDLDFNKVFFRVEKQCFTRLPETGSDLMFIRTYVTSLMDLRGSLTEEEKEILCSAIDGIMGDFAIYKKRIQWGEAAKAFIMGESNGSNPVKTKYTFVS